MVNFDPISNNFLDRSFQKVLFPYRCLHHALFLSRFSIKYNCIRYHDRMYYMFSSIGIICILLYIYRSLATMFLDSVNGFIDIFLWMNVFFLVFPFIMFYVINIVQRRNHIKIVLKIQKSFRIVHYKAFKQCILWSWLGVFCHTCWVILSLVLFQDFSVVFSFYVMTFVDLNTTYGNSMIFLIRNGMAAWISEVEYQCKTCLDFEERKRIDTFSKLFQAYEDLMEAYNIFKNIFKFPILFHTLNTFFLSLFYIQMIIELQQLNISHIGLYHINMLTVLTVLWLLKNVSYVFVFSISCEKFYICVTDANNTCYKLLKRFQNTVAVKNLCKNVLRSHRATFHKMSACNIFTVDAELAHGFTSLEVEYIIVLLQFAFTRFKY